MSNIISEEIKRSIVNDYCSHPQSISVIADKYGYCKPTISKILSQYGVKAYTQQQIYSYGTNEDIFNIIDNEEKAYFLGFLLADGCVFYNKYNPNACPRVIFELQNSDAYMVERFHKFTNAQTSLRRANGYNRNTTSCAISSFKMAKDLSFFSIDLPKFLRPLPIVRPDLVNHLIRGFFDGDGCFTFRLAHPERKVCNFYSGKVAIVTYEILKSDLIMILNHIGIDRYHVERCNSQVYLEMVDITRKDDILKFYNFIYSNASIYLMRKKEKFESYFVLNNMI